MCRGSTAPCNMQMDSHVSAWRRNRARCNLQFPSAVHSSSTLVCDFVPAVHAGYWAQDWSRVEPHHGTEQDLTDMIKAAHDKGGLLDV